MSLREPDAAAQETYPISRTGTHGYRYHRHSCGHASDTELPLAYLRANKQYKPCKSCWGEAEQRKGDLR